MHIYVIKDSNKSHLRLVNYHRIIFLTYCLALYLKNYHSWIHPTTRQLSRCLRRHCPSIVARLKRGCSGAIYWFGIVMLYYIQFHKKGIKKYTRTRFSSFAYNCQSKSKCQYRGKMGSKWGKGSWISFSPRNWPTLLFSYHVCTSGRF